jgi:phosphoribosylformylglycinamidine synthase
MERIGRTIADRLIFELTDDDHVVTLAQLRTAHEGFFPALMGADIIG